MSYETKLLVGLLLSIVAVILVTPWLSWGLIEYFYWFGGIVTEYSKITGANP